MIFADHLSRNLEVSSLELNASLSKLKHIRQETECYPQMLVFKETIIQGWPKDIKQCPLPLCSFWNFRDELSIIDESGERKPHCNTNKIPTRTTQLIA